MARYVPIWVGSLEYWVIASRDLGSMSGRYESVPRALRSAVFRHLALEPWRAQELRALWERECAHGDAAVQEPDERVVARVERELVENKGRFTLVRALREEGGFTVVTSDDDDDETTVRQADPDLVLLEVDSHFASGREMLDITYSIRNYHEEDTVTLEVTSPHHASPLYKLKLTGADKCDGVHQFRWNGRTNVTAGPMKDRYIHPLLAPFKVTLTGSLGHRGELPFTVLYAGVRLTRGAWVPADDRPTPEDRRTHWVQWQLNELGHHAAPVTGTLDDATKSAIKRYKRYHSALAADTTDAITDALVERLRAGDNARAVFDRVDALTDRALAAKVYTDGDQYYRAYSDLLTPSVKVNHERDALGRPAFVLRCEALLLAKAKRLGDEGAGVWSPEGVGPVRVRWFTEDPAEDTTLLPDGSVATVPSRTKQYVDLALPLTAPPGDNCGSTYGGLRAGGALDHRPLYFDSTGLLPYSVEEDGGERARVTRAHVDTSRARELVGGASIVAHPSYIAGDSYRFGAALDFKGEANQAYLDGQYPAAKRALLAATTGTLTVWRRMRVAAHITWGRRSETGEALSWGAVFARFREAYLDYEGPARTMGRSGFLSLADYNNIVQARCSNAAYRAAVQADVTAAAAGNPTQLDLANYAADARSARLPGESLANYGIRLGGLMSTVWSEISGDVVARIESQLRPGSPQGLLVLDFKAICPTQWRAAGGVGDVPAGRSAWADKRGVTVIEVDLPMDQDTLMAHEIGHNLYLSHWEVPAGDTYRRPVDHDLRDHNCMMSYAWNIPSRPALAANGWLFLGRFCGRCNLKLRGWDIGAGALPAQS